MKRLIWIAAKNREDLFTELFADNDIFPRYYDIEQIPSLTAFVTRSKIIADQDYFVVDLSESNYDDDMIVDAIRMIKQLSAARPIFIAPACEEVDILFGRLEAENVPNVIKEKPGMDLVAEMRTCISTSGRSFASRVADLQNSMAANAMAIVRPITIPSDTRIRVAVAGTMSRVGTTTQAAAIYRYLNKLGFSPLLIDGTKNIFDTIQMVYPDRIVNRGTYLELDGMAISDEDVPDTCFNARIIDLGVLDANTASVFMEVDVPVLVSGIKPWELAHLARAKKLLATSGSEQYATAVSFAAAYELNQLRKYFGDMAEAVPYRPDIFGSSADLDYSAYHQMLLARLKELCAV